MNTNPYNLLYEIAADSELLMNHAIAGGIAQGAIELMVDNKELKAAHAYLASLLADVEHEIADRTSD